MSAKRIDVVVNVTDSAAGGESLQIAASVFLPEETSAGDSLAVMYAFPGGGYNRHYFDLQFPGHPGYSQAEHHVAQGFAVVAIDHIGSGDSSTARASLNYADIARVNAAAVAEISDLLELGTLSPGIPVIRCATKIGMGQSYGGLLLTFLEGDHPTFEGVAFLGWSAIQSTPRMDIGMPAMSALELASGSGLAHPLRRAMHFDDEPEALVEQDMRGWPHREGVPVPYWATPHMPGGPNAFSEKTPVDPGVVAEPAARIACPVFVACGERDVIADIRQEPGAYSASTDITLFLLRKSSHMHNFASTRRVLWARLDAWARGLGALSN